MRDPGPRAASGVSCGIQCGAGASYGIRRSTWDPGLSTTSRMPCGIQCGIMVFNVGARTSNVIPTSVRDPQRGSIDVVRGPDFHAGGKAGSWIPYVIPNPEFTCDVFHSVRYPTLSWLRSEGGPLGGVPPSLDIPAPRSSGMPRNLL